MHVYVCQIHGWAGDAIWWPKLKTWCNLSGSGQIIIEITFHFMVYRHHKVKHCSIRPNRLSYHNWIRYFSLWLGLTIDLDTPTSATHQEPSFLTNLKSNFLTVFSLHTTKPPAPTGQDCGQQHTSNHNFQQSCQPTCTKIYAEHFHQNPQHHCFCIHHQTMANKTPPLAKKEPQEFDTKLGSKKSWWPFIPSENKGGDDHSSLIMPPLLKNSSYVINQKYLYIDPSGSWDSWPCGFIGNKLCIDLQQFIVQMNQH